MIAVRELEAERSESGCSVTCQQIWLQLPCEMYEALKLSGSITDQPVWHMTSEVTTRRHKPFGSMSRAPAGKGAANVPHEGLRSYLGSPIRCDPMSSAGICLVFLDLGCVYVCLRPFYF